MVRAIFKMAWLPLPESSFFSAFSFLGKDISGLEFQLLHQLQIQSY